MPTNTRPRARRRTGPSLTGQLNAEWATLVDDPATAVTVAGWGAGDPALAACRRLGDVERAVAAADRDGTDAILLSLLRLAHDGDQLASRTVLQLMLGKAIRIAASHRGRDSRENLEHIAVTALWTTIASYPVEHRRTKVAANLAMDTLGLVSRELAVRCAELPAEPFTLAATLAEPTPFTRGRTGEDWFGRSSPVDLELLELLAWAVDQDTITVAEARLIMDVYAPAPGCAGGAAAAVRHGLSWPAARQRVSRAVRRITANVRADAA